MKKFYVLHDEEKVIGLYKLTEGEAAIVLNIFEKINEDDTVGFYYEFNEFGRMRYYENKEH